jgi:hypothetical protein
MGVPETAIETALRHAIPLADEERRRTEASLRRELPPEIFDYLFTPEERRNLELKILKKYLDAEEQMPVIGRWIRIK